MTTRPAWTRRVKVGDVLANRRYRRIVRLVVYRDGELHCVVFSILRCSWTERCYTHLMYPDLMGAGYAPVGEKMKLDKRIDKKIARCIERHEKKYQTLDCCDVRGVT